MNQPILEVKERKSILILGIICSIIFGVIIAMCMLAAEDAAFAGIRHDTHNIVQDFLLYFEHDIVYNNSILILLY